MGNKTSTVEMKNANVDTPFGKCGLGSCKSSCCEDEQQKEPEELKKIRVAIRVEFAMLEKLMLDKKLAAFKQDGSLPELQIVADATPPQNALKRTLTLKVIDQSPIEHIENESNKKMLNFSIDA